MTAPEPHRESASPTANDRDAPSPAAEATPAADNRASRFATLAVVLVVLLAGLFSLRKIHDYDVLWHVRTGDWILAESRVPHTDPFGQDPAQPWIAVSWAADVAMALVARAGGLEALHLALTVMVMASLGAALWWSVRSPLVLFCGLLVVFTAWSRFLVRPDALSLPLVLLVLALEGRLERNGTRGVLAVAAVAVFWCNVHGSFVLAPLLLAAALAGRLLAGRPVRAHVAALVAVALAPLVTPYSVGLYALLTPYLESLLAAVGIGEMRPLTLVEWRPTWKLLLADPVFPRLAMPLLLLVTVFSLVRGGRPRWHAGRIVQLAAVTGLALTAVRHLLPFAAACLALVCASERSRATATLDRGRHGRALPAWLPPATVAVLALVAAVQVMTDRYYVSRDVPLRTGLGLDRSLVPEGAARWLAGHRVAGRVFNNFDSGAYLHYRLYPRFRPYLDARLVNAETYFDVRDAVSALPVFEERVRRQGIDTVALVHPSSETFTLLPYLTRENGWRLVARDRVSTIHLRADAPPPVVRQPPWGLSEDGSLAAVAVGLDGALGKLKTHALPAADLTDALVSRLIGDHRREAAAFRRARREAPDHPRVRAYFESRPRRRRDGEAGSS